jgi:pilus assembly protein CpaE
MHNARSNDSASAARIVVLTADPGFAGTIRGVFAAGQKIGLTLVEGTPSQVRNIDIGEAVAFIVDLADGDEHELQALEAMMRQAAAACPPVIAVTSGFDGTVARRLMQMRVADFLTKPVAPVELVRACARVAKATAKTGTAEAQTFTFLPAVGGAGVTTLAVQTAMLLLNAGTRSKTATCLVDLDFQHGACADYLDIEPRLNLGEIEPRPERLDRQLLEVMLSYHSSGLAVVAAPNRPAEMRSFDPGVVTRLLDLVSSHFDNVVFDMPRTWFSWTDSVLLGSNRVFIVSETTVPSLRQARQLLEAIRERLGDDVKPRVIVNRFDQRLFSPGLRRADIEKAIGNAVAGYMPNNYALVREAIDRGVPLDEIKPGNTITAQLKKVLLPQAVGDAEKTSGVATKSSRWGRRSFGFGGGAKSMTAP